MDERERGEVPAAGDCCIDAHPAGISYCPDEDDSDNDDADDDKYEDEEE